MEASRNQDWERVEQQQYRSRAFRDRCHKPRRRPGFAFALGLVLVGTVLVVDTVWPQFEVEPSRIRQEQQKAALQFIRALDDDKGSRHSQSVEESWKHNQIQLAQNNPPNGQIDNTTVGPPRDPSQELPLVQSIVPGKQVLRDYGGAQVTVLGRHFGNEDSEIDVKFGDRWSPHIEWLNDDMIVATTPMGVGKDLDVTVRVTTPGFGAIVGVGKGLFSYTRPFIYDVVPFQVGSPLTGPMNLTIKAWGVGYWDTHPEAQVNGQKCSQTIWVDNSSVICTIPKQVRISLQNPELYVGGQRSMCGILAPGLCTVTSQYSSVTDPKRIRQEIRELKARGSDWKKAARTLGSGTTIGGLGAENSPENPCRDIGTCTPQTLFLSLSSSIMMMMGMGSLCACILAAKPLAEWISDDWRRAREESKRGPYEDILAADEEEEGEEEEEGSDELLEDDSALEARQFDFSIRVF